MIDQHPKGNDTEPVYPAGRRDTLAESGLASARSYVPAVTLIIALLLMLAASLGVNLISSNENALSVGDHGDFRSPALWMLLSAMAVATSIALGLQLRRYRDRIEKALAEKNQVLRENEEFIRGLFDDNPSVTLLIEPHSGRIMAANNAAVLFYGYPREALVAMTIDDINVLPAPRIAEARRDALRQSRSFFEFPHRLANGEIRDVEVFVKPIESEGRDLLLSIIHDVSAHKHAQRALRESEQRLRIAGRASYDVIYEWDPTSGKLTWFGDIDSMLGFAYGEIRRDNQWQTLVHPDDRRAIEDAMACRQRNTETCVVEYRIATQSGEYRSWLDKSSALLDENGRAYKWVGVCTDITERKKADDDLRLAAAVFQHAQESIIIADAQRNIVDVNEAFTTISGFSHDEVIGRNPRFLNSGRQDVQFYDRMWKTIDQTGRWFGEIWNRRKNGELFAELMSISAILDDDGNVQNYVALASDVTEHKTHQEQLEHIAYHDSLTNLPNRILLSDRLHQAIAHSARHGGMVAVAYLDLDGFKEINDEFGHDIGDRLLIDIANRLKASLRGDDTVARLGGDEFVAVLTGLDNTNACIEILPRLLQAASQPLHVADEVRSVSASLGVTFYPQTEKVDADQLLRQADQAMYQAKLEGKNRYHLFDAEQDRSLRGQVERLEQIRHALKHEQFALHYQPKVNMRSGEIVGAEALIRWPLGDGKYRYPNEFLPLIENHPLAVELDEWVINHALQQMETWQTDGFDVSVSVNVSAYHLQQTDFIDRLKRLLDAHPSVDPGDLVVEILETTALMDLARISEVIRAGQRLGVVFALDDFGTGYSSLSYLKSLPAHQLKIDQTFVRGMLDDREDLAILEGIMGLAAAFSREAIAEGVETIEHGEILLQLGCDLAQGYCIGRPMPADDFVAWAGTWVPNPSWQNQRPIQRADLPLVFSMVEHRAWVSQLENYVGGKLSVAPQLDHSECRFGQWFNKDGRTRFGEHHEYAEIRQLHENVHHLARRLVDRHIDGSTDEVDRLLFEIRAIRDTLTGKLKRLLHHSDQRMTGAA